MLPKGNQHGVSNLLVGISHVFLFCNFVLQHLGALLTLGRLRLGGLANS